MDDSFSGGTGTTPTGSLVPIHVEDSPATPSSINDNTQSPTPFLLPK